MKKDYNAVKALLGLLVVVSASSSCATLVLADNSRPFALGSGHLHLSNSVDNDLATACAEQIKACFAQSEPERSECFYNSGNDSACINSELGRLSLKRWSMSAGQPAGEEAPLGLLGPKLVDKNCVENFDGQWSSAMLSQELGDSDWAKLSQRLDGCIQKPDPDFTRP